MASARSSQSESPSRHFLSWGRKAPRAAPQAPPAPTHRLKEAVAAAESALKSGDFRGVWACASPMRAEARQHLVGRLLELSGLCAAAGLAGPHEAKAWLTDALWAFQNSHNVAGMARAHRALGVMAGDKGQLEEAERELGYALTLAGRGNDAPLRAGIVRLQAEVALMRGDAEDALAKSVDATAQALEIGPELEAAARLVQAEIFAAGGHKAPAARELLWAERLAALVPSLTGQLSLTLKRAQTLLRLDCPRRASTVLAPWQNHALLAQHPGSEAHYKRLWGLAQIQDNTPAARAALTDAQRSYTARRLTYLSTTCAIGLARVAVREGDGERAAFDAIDERALEPWPLLKHALEVAQFERANPTTPALGAVSTPWVRAVGQVDLSASAHQTPPTPSAQASHSSPSNKRA